MCLCSYVKVRNYIPSWSYSSKHTPTHIHSWINMQNTCTFIRGRIEVLKKAYIDTCIDKSRSRYVYYQWRHTKTKYINVNSYVPTYCSYLQETCRVTSASYKTDWEKQQQNYLNESIYIYIYICIYAYNCIYGAYGFRCLFHHGNVYMASWVP